jgi:hypothetical protein
MITAIIGIHVRFHDLDDTQEAVAATCQQVEEAARRQLLRLNLPAIVADPEKDLSIGSVIYVNDTLQVDPIETLQTEASLRLRLRDFGLMVGDWLTPVAIRVIQACNPYKDELLASKLDELANRYRKRPIQDSASTPDITYDYDGASDVLYVKLPGVDIYASHGLSDDDFVILNVDRDGNVVGLQLLGVVESMPLERWQTHFHTNEIPMPLFEAVSQWLGERRSLIERYRAFAAKHDA